MRFIKYEMSDSRCFVFDAQRLRRKKENCMSRNIYNSCFRKFEEPPEEEVIMVSLVNSKKAPEILEKQRLYCSLISGKYKNHRQVPALYCDAHHMWKSTWSKIFEKAGAKCSLDIEKFLRQDVIIALHNEKDLIGVLKSTFFNLAAHGTLDHLV